jgi:hypothetical protein
LALVAVAAGALVVAASLAEAARAHGSASKVTANTTGEINFICFFIFNSFNIFSSCYSVTI